MPTVHIPSHFRDTNYNVVPYDGSPVTWRVSVYGCWVVNQKLLMVKHEDEKYWDIPGGGVEMGETLSEALRREGLEEAGCQWQLHQLFASAEDWFYHQGEKRFYRALQLFALAEGIMPLQAQSETKIKQVEFCTWEQVLERLYPHVFSAIKEQLEILLHTSSAHPQATNNTV